MTLQKFRRNLTPKGGAEKCRDIFHYDPPLGAECHFLKKQVLTLRGSGDTADKNQATNGRHFERHFAKIAHFESDKWATRGDKLLKKHRKCVAELRNF